MKALLALLGSRGDVQPELVLAKSRRAAATPRRLGVPNFGLGRVPWYGFIPVGEEITSLFARTAT